MSETAKEAVRANYAESSAPEGVLFNTEDAKKYGIRCILSERIKNYGNTGADGEKINPDNRQSLDIQATVESQLSAITATVCRDMRVYRIDEDCFLCYHRDETVETVAAEVMKLYPTSLYPIPAAYSMRYGAIREITCPFFSFVKPFTVLLFQNRYTLGSLVSYYYWPEEGLDAFFALNTSGTFSTVGEENTFTIRCVDSDALQSAADKVFADSTSEVVSPVAQGSAGKVSPGKSVMDDILAQLKAGGG
jgi:hypothetical protein